MSSSHFNRRDKILLETSGKKITPKPTHFGFDFVHIHIMSLTCHLNNTVATMFVLLQTCLLSLCFLKKELKNQTVLFLSEADENGKSQRHRKLLKIETPVITDLILNVKQSCHKMLQNTFAKPALSICILELQRNQNKYQIKYIKCNKRCTLKMEENTVESTTD